MEEAKGMSIRRQLVDLSMSIVMVAILLSTGVTLALTLREEYRHMEESLTDLSMLLSRTPVVRSALESAEGGEDLDGFLQEMARILWMAGLSGFTRKRKATPLANLETMNQSQHIPNT